MVNGGRRLTETLPADQLQAGMIPIPAFDPKVWDVELIREYRTRMSRIETAGSISQKARQLAAICKTEYLTRWEKLEKEGATLHHCCAIGNDAETHKEATRIIGSRVVVLNVSMRTNHERRTTDLELRRRCEKCNDSRYALIELDPDAMDHDDPAARHLVFQTLMAQCVETILPAKSVIGPLDSPVELPEVDMAALSVYPSKDELKECSICGTSDWDEPCPHQIDTFYEESNDDD